MRVLTAGVCALVVLSAGMAAAQQAHRGTRQAIRVAGRDRTPIITSSGQVQPTPEMWFYEQYQQRYDTPAAKVEQNALFRATQREHRLAARRWFGLSNVRPQASSDPFHGDYSARWTSNNGFYPQRWTGWGGGWIIGRTAD